MSKNRGIGVLMLYFLSVEWFLNELYLYSSSRFGGLKANFEAANRQTKMVDVAWINRELIPNMYNYLSAKRSQKATSK